MGLVKLFISMSKNFTSPKKSKIFLSPNFRTLPKKFPTSWSLRVTFPYMRRACSWKSFVQALMGARLRPTRFLADALQATVGQARYRWPVPLLTQAPSGARLHCLRSRLFLRGSASCDVLKKKKKYMPRMIFIDREKYPTVNGARLPGGKASCPRTVSKSAAVRVISRAGDTETRPLKIRTKRAGVACERARTRVSVKKIKKNFFSLDWNDRSTNPSVKHSGSQTRAIDVGEIIFFILGEREVGVCGADASPSGFLSLGLAEKAKGCAGVSFSGGVVWCVRCEVWCAAIDNPVWARALASGVCTCICSFSWALAEREAPPVAPRKKGSG